MLCLNFVYRFSHASYPRYDSSATFADNVELTADPSVDPDTQHMFFEITILYAHQDPILQRFDILCVLQDVVDP